MSGGNGCSPVKPPPVEKTCPPGHRPAVRNGTLSNVLGYTVGPTELIIVLVIVLVLFGGAKLPKLARSLGQAQREFREGVAEADNAADDSSSADSKPSSS